MRQIAILLSFCVLLTAHAGPQAPASDIGAADRAAIFRTIDDQIAAFRRDDGPAAFAFASPSIQRQFATPDIFMNMVRNGYAAVYRPRSVAFGELLRVDSTLLQLVEVVGPDGAPVLAVYEMERQGDGSWRIAGCALYPIDRRAT
jgi:hypothetical protein